MPHPPPADLACPICAGTAFRREHTRLSGKQRQRRFKATLMICAQCSHIVLFEGWHDDEPSAGVEIVGAT